MKTNQPILILALFVSVFVLVSGCAMPFQSTETHNTDTIKQISNITLLYTVGGYYEYPIGSSGTYNIEIATSDRDCAIESGYEYKTNNPTINRFGIENHFIKNHIWLGGSNKNSILSTTFETPKNASDQKIIVYCSYRGMISPILPCPATISIAKVE